MRRNTTRHTVVFSVFCQGVIPSADELTYTGIDPEGTGTDGKRCRVTRGNAARYIIWGESFMRTLRHKSKQSMDQNVFLEGALKFARIHKLDFTGYDTQYQALRCNFLPLLKDGSVVGVISMDSNGDYQYKELVRDPTLPGAPRGC
jgi:hypothetical protein